MSNLAESESVPTDEEILKKETELAALRKHLLVLLICMKCGSHVVR